MKAKEATDLGLRLAAYVRDGQLACAYELLRPVLRERTPFSTLRRIAGPIGGEPLALANALLERVAAGATEGGWVIIGQVLEQQLDRDLSGALARCHRFVVAADVWYGADILGEHVPGPALLRHYEPALRELDPWRGDDSAWIRRAVGVAVHHWAKRSRGGCEHVDEVESLAIERCRQLFGCEHANVQPHSGSQANMAVYLSQLKPGDCVLAMDLSHGGHLSHGAKWNFSGKLYHFISYGVRRDNETLDYDQISTLAKKHKPPNQQNHN